jgi:hypothetical protein
MRSKLFRYMAFVAVTGFCFWTSGIQADELPSCASMIDEPCYPAGWSALCCSSLGRINECQCVGDGESQSGTWWCKGTDQ